jgi:Amiloride-sensitive sodium channel
MSNALKVYCAESSIHGIPYIVNRKLSLFEKFLWIVAVIVSFICCGFMIFKIGAKFHEDAMVIFASDTAIAVTDVRVSVIVRQILILIWIQIPFAAVTYCPDLKTHNDEFDYNQIVASLKDNMISIENVTNHE